jgi:hypothetical protein
MAQAQTTTEQRVLSTLPYGRTGPLPQVPLDSIAPVPAQVSYRDGELTIIAHNSTLSDILRGIRDQTKAEIEIPIANDRVVIDLGPGPVREVLAELLNGTPYNYILLGSTTGANITRVILLLRDGGDVAGPAQPTAMQETPPNLVGRTNQKQELTTQQQVPVDQEVKGPRPKQTGPVEMTDEP